MKRFLIPAAAATSLALCALIVVASDPESQDVIVPSTPGQVVVVEWTGTVNPGATGAGTNSCDTGAGAPAEDVHTINLTAVDGTYDRVNVSAAFHVEWDTAGSDMVLSVIKDGTTIGSSDGGEPQENVVSINPQSGEFLAVTCPFAVTTATPYRGRLTLSAARKQTVAEQSPTAGTGNAAGLPPRFQSYAPNYAKDGFGMFGGEATMDVHPTTGSLFYIGFLETLRLRLDDRTSPATQTWNLSNTIASSLATSDPILVSDRATGRIFAMQLLFAEGQSAMDYSDDDGDTWTPALAGAVGRSGADHQGMDVGPYPTTGLGASIPHPLYPSAVYYCSQDIATVYCSRSDDGTISFNPSTVVYSLLDCQGLHGHPKVAPDGTVHLPVSACPSPIVDAANAQPAVVVSEDAGLSWEIRPINTAAPGTGGHGADPSVAFATDNTVYAGFVTNDNHLHMAKSADHGLTWTNDVDISALAGIRAAEFPAVIAGDPDRAGVAFFGTTYTGPELNSAENFPGEWHLYVAMTYDGGQTYHVSNLTPNDPIQKGGICSGGFCRNLLDFFDAVVDTEGRMVISYEDGCVGGCPAGSHGTFSDQTVIARQSGGRRLFAANDPVEPTRPASPRLEGYRADGFTYLDWPATDSGGSAVTEYKVYRGVNEASLAFLATAGSFTQYVDSAPPAGPLVYAISAVNAQGEGLKGNALPLSIGDNVLPATDACTLPGISMAVDRTGEPEAAPATRDIAEIFVAEPEDMPGMLVFSLQFDQAAPPNQGGGPTTRVFFDLPNGGQRIRLQVSGAAGAGTYGHIQADPTTGIHNTYIADGVLDAGSGFVSGTSRFVIAKEKLGLATGDTLKSVYGLTLPPGAGSNITTEEAGYFDYTLLGNDFCAKGGVLLPPEVPVVVPPVVEVPVVKTPDEGRFGTTSLGWLLLLPLGLMAALRRRH